MTRLETKNSNMTLIEKQQKYQHYHVVKLMNMSILQVKKYYLLILNSPLGKDFENQVKGIEYIKKKVEDLKF